MSWFKVDDSFPQHRKVLRIPRKHRLACIGLWMSGAAWCSRHLSDGWLDRFLVDELGGTDDQADWLIKVGLWIDKGEHVLFHDWSDYQTTRAQVDEKKEKDAERKRKAREAFEKKRARLQASVQSDSENVTTESAQSPRGQDAESEQRPERVRSTETETPTETPTEAPTPTATETPTEVLKACATATPQHVDVPDLFEQFWKAYPRKAVKKTARQSWARAIKREKPEVIAAAAERMANDPNLPTDETKIPHPATWLNQDRWNEPPYPAATSGRKRNADDKAMDFINIGRQLDAELPMEIEA